MHKEWFLSAWMSMHKVASESADANCKVGRCFVSGSIIPRDCSNRQCPPCVKKVIFSISKCHELDNTHTCASGYTYCPQLSESSKTNGTTFSVENTTNTTAKVPQVTSIREANTTQSTDFSPQQKSTNLTLPTTITEKPEEVSKLDEEIKNNTSTPTRPVSVETRSNSNTGIMLMIAAFVGAVIALVLAGVARYYWKHFQSDEETDERMTRSYELSEKYHPYRQAKDTSVSPKYDRDVYSSQRQRAESLTVHEHPIQQTDDTLAIQFPLPPPYRPSEPSMESKRKGSTVSVEF